MGELKRASDLAYAACQEIQLADEAHDASGYVPQRCCQMILAWSARILWTIEREPAVTIRFNEAIRMIADLCFAYGAAVVAATPQSHCAPDRDFESAIFCGGVVLRLLESDRALTETKQDI